jgi:LysR family transcriptional activator of nhaA
MPKRRINYQHLHYFRTVAHEGSVTRAAGKLNVTQPAISTQLRKLERSLGEKLFEKSGRSLVLTEAGKVVLGYADEIFSLGHELTETLAGRPTGRPLRFTVGIAEVMPKILTQRLLAPALAMKPRVQLFVQEDEPERLATRLIGHEIDLLLTDAPLSRSPRMAVYNHLLGECGTTFFATPALARRYKRDFPASLHEAPFLLPAHNAAVRQALSTWFEEHLIQPNMVAEIEDSGVLKAFGQSGAGVFAAPSVIESEIRRQYRVEVVGRAPDIRERFYAISVERRIKHPAVLAMSESARSRIFSDS